MIEEGLDRDDRIDADVLQELRHPDGLPRRGTACVDDDLQLIGRSDDDLGRTPALLLA
jgi:hypothetical protein